MTAHKRFELTLVALLIVALALAACSSRNTATPTSTAVQTGQPTEVAAEPAPAETVEPTPSPTPAAKGSQGNPLLQLFVPSGASEQIQAGAAELDRLMAEQGIYLSSSMAASYAAAIEALCAGRADIVWLAPLSYTIAKDKCPDASLLLSSIRFGSQFYKGQILAGADSGIEKLEDLNGKRFAFTDPASTSGYLYPIALLESEGVELGDSFFAGSHNAAALAVYNGQADAAAAFDDVRNSLEESFPDIKQKTKVIALTEDIPNDTVTASPELPSEVARAYQRALLDVVSSDAGKKAIYDLYEWEGVAEVKDDVFDPIRQAAAAIGVSNLQDWKGVSQPYRVGLVTDRGRVDDGGFNQSAYAGLKKAETDFGLKTAFIETVDAGDYERNLAAFAGQGYDLVVTVGAPMGEITQQMARQYPGTRFVIVDFAYEAYPDNLHSLVFREDQAGFLAGALAGQMSQSGVVGIVSGAQGASAEAWRNGYENGVTCVCPECNVLTSAVDDLDDRVRGRAAALSQLGESADVIFGVGGLTGAGAIAGAAQEDVWAIGSDQDQYVTTFQGGATEGAARLLSSAVKRVDEAVYDAIKSLVSGAFSSGVQRYDVANQGIDLAPFHDAEIDISDDVKATLEDVAARLASGELLTGVDPGSGRLIEAQAPPAGSCRLAAAPAETPSGAP